MRCYLNKKSQQQSKSQTYSQALEGQKIFYSQVHQERTFYYLKGMFDIFEIQGHAFIYYWNDNENFHIFDLETGKDYKFCLQGRMQRVITEKKKILIITSRRLYFLQMIDKIQILGHIIINKNCCMLQMYSNLILWKMNNDFQIVKLGINHKHKILFQYRNAHIFLHQLFYSKQKGVLVYSVNQYIEIYYVVSKIRKQVMIRKPTESQMEIKYMKIVENIIELFIYVQFGGLFLYKINFLNGTVEATKFLYSDVRDFQIIDDQNMLALVTSNFYMIFDKEYSILQKFEINYEFYNNIDTYRCFFKRCSGYIIIIKQLNHQDCKLRFYKENKNLKKGELWIKAVENYSVELDSKIHNHIDISQNQQYLAFDQGYLLIFYQISEKTENYLSFNQQVKFLGFSMNSNTSYVSCSNMIICIKCPQNMKIQKRYIQNDNEISQRDFSTGQNGFFSVIDKAGVKIYQNQTNKQIFRLKHQLIYSRQHNYWNSREVFLIDNGQEIVIYRLNDRKQLIKLKINNRGCILAQNGQKLLIQTIEGQLQLWKLKSENAILQRIIIDDVKFIYNNSLDRIIIMSDKQEIFVFDQRLKIVKKINKDKQILALNENYLLQAKQSNFHRLADTYQLVRK